MYIGIGAVVVILIIILLVLLLRWSGWRVGRPSRRPHLDVAAARFSHGAAALSWAASAAQGQPVPAPLQHAVPASAAALQGLLTALDGRLTDW